MSVVIETKGGNIVGVADDTGTNVDFTINDTSTTPVEVVAKAAADAAAKADATASGPSAVEAAKAAADATAKAADEVAATYDDAATPGDTTPTT